MPFGEYENFEACVRANQDKSDPEAYCGEIKRRVEKEAINRAIRKSSRLTPRRTTITLTITPIEKSAPPPTDEFARVTVSKTDSPERLVFGWASIVTKDGQPLTDLQKHEIPVPELESAAYVFNERYRQTGIEHAGDPVGNLVESMVFTDEKIAEIEKSLGVTMPENFPNAWWVGFRVPPAVFTKVQSGIYKMFSIQGGAVLEPVWD